MKQIKIAITISIIFLLNIKITAQNSNNYIEYYNLINDAEIFYAQKLYDSCFLSYQKAFAKVDYIHNANLRNAADVCKKLGQKEQSKIYLEMIKSHERSINLSHKNYLDSLQMEDQRIRSAKFIKARNYYIRSMRDSTFVPKEKTLAKSKTLMLEWWATDSSNVELLKKFISENGFPGEKMVGSETTSSVSVILLHYDRDTSNHIMGEIIKKALYDGDLSPRMYAWIIDRHLRSAGKPQLYYTIPLSTPNQLSKEKREIINTKRESIGLKRLDEVKIIYRKNSVSVRYN